MQKLDVKDADEIVDKKFSSTYADRKAEMDNASAGLDNSIESINKKLRPVSGGQISQNSRRAAALN